MRLRLTLDRLVLLDVTILEPDDEDAEPDEIHDLSTDHGLGFTADVGWTD